MKTRELTGLPLAWATLLAQGIRRWDPNISDVEGAHYEAAGYFDEELSQMVITDLLLAGKSYEPDTNWAQGGPLVSQYVNNLLGFRILLWVDA